MPDMFETAKRPYIRMSETGSCALRIGYSIMGLPKRDQPTSIPMMMGTALEPMVNEHILNQGFSLAFHKTMGNDKEPPQNNQIEIARVDPYQTGHPDGVIWLKSGTKLTKWAYNTFPGEAIERLKAGELFVYEVKTMNPDDFSKFRQFGLAAPVRLFEGYRRQSWAYVDTMSNAANDEAWPESVKLRTLLREENMQRPRQELMVAFCPSTKEFHADLVNHDPDAFSQAVARLTDTVIKPMREEGKFPEPTHDGTSAECWWCPFTHICPAIIERKREQQAKFSDNLLDVRMDLPLVSDEEMNLKLTELVRIQRELKGLDEERKLIRREITELLGAGNSMLTDNFSVRITAIKGVRRFDATRAKELITDAGLEIPYSVGASSNRLYISARFGNEEIDAALKADD